MGINKKVKDFQKLFLDMDAFFASIEQQVQPPLRNRPVGVAPYAGNTGCVIAASYPAKERGVKTGTKVKKAKKLCPDIKILSARYKLYIFYHQQIKETLNSLSPFVTPLSVDEFCIDLSKNNQEKEKAVQFAKEIKKTILEKTGDYLHCSIGIGPNQILAKMAAEKDKPNGLKVLTLKNLSSFYAGLSLTDIPGIGGKTAKRLKRAGIKNPLALYNTDLKTLENLLGKAGKGWFFNLRGCELERKTRTRSISQSHVLPPEFRSKKEAEKIIKRLVYKAGKRMRKKGFWAKGVGTTIFFFKGKKFKRTKRTGPFFDNLSFIKNIGSLLKKCSWERKPLKVKIRAFNLTKKSLPQPSLFKKIEKQRKLSKALDKINEKYKGQVISRASAFEAKKEAPDRISFGRPQF